MGDGGGEERRVVSLHEDVPLRVQLARTPVGEFGPAYAAVSAAQLQLAADAAAVAGGNPKRPGSAGEDALLALSMKPGSRVGGYGPRIGRKQGDLSVTLTDRTGATVVRLDAGSHLEACRLEEVLSAASEVSSIESLIGRSVAHFNTSRVVVDRLPKPPKWGEPNPHKRRVPLRVPKVEDYIPDYLLPMNRRTGTAKTGATKIASKVSRKATKQTKRPSKELAPGIPRKLPTPVRAPDPPMPVYSPSGATRSVMNPALEAEPTAPQMVNRVKSNQWCHMCHHRRPGVIGCDDTNTRHRYCAVCMDSRFQVDWNAVRAGLVHWTCPACTDRCPCRSCVTRLKPKDGSAHAKSPRVRTPKGTPKSAAKAAKVSKTAKTAPGPVQTPEVSAEPVQSAKAHFEGLPIVCTIGRSMRRRTTMRYYTPEKESAAARFVMWLASNGRAPTFMNPSLMSSSRAAIDAGQPAGPGGLSFVYHPPATVRTATTASVTATGVDVRSTMASPGGAGANTSAGQGPKLTGSSKVGSTPSRLHASMDVPLTQPAPAPESSSTSATSTTPAAPLPTQSPATSTIVDGAGSMPAAPPVPSGGAATTTRAPSAAAGPASGATAPPSSAPQQVVSTVPTVPLCFNHNTPGHVLGGSMSVHPYVPCTCTGTPVYTCTGCLSALAMKRDSAMKANRLLVVGQPYESMCTLCGALPEHDTSGVRFSTCVAKHCVRSYCPACIRRVINEPAIVAAIRQQQANATVAGDLLCPPCAVSALAFYGGMGLTQNSALALMGSVTVPQQLVFVPGSPGAYGATVDVGSLIRKVPDAPKTAPTAPSATKRQRPASVPPPKRPQIVHASADSHFAKYAIQLLDFRLKAPKDPAATGKVPPESVCFHCKGAHPVVKCTYAPNNISPCPKMFHPECTGVVSREFNRWRCPRHYCISCGDYSVYLCVFCPNGFCKKHRAKHACLPAQLDPQWQAVGRALEVPKSKIEIVCQSCAAVYKRVKESGIAASVAGHSDAPMPSAGSSAPMPSAGAAVGSEAAASDGMSFLNGTMLNSEDGAAPAKKPRIG